jgi:hypothetical protein
MRRSLVGLLLTTILASGCDHPFEPYQEDVGAPFSIFGYLDLRADTQWIRVMPIRQSLLADPAPVDAVVTLEEVGSGRIVTLRDSLFAFEDRGVDGVAYAHNFWTTERIEPGTTYRLEAVRSDGVASTATVAMPPELVLSIQYWEISGQSGLWEPRRLFVHAEHPLYVDLFYTVWEMDAERGVPPVRMRLDPRATNPGRWEFGLPGVGPFQLLDMPPYMDMVRREVRLAVAGSDWPYGPGLPDTDIAIPGKLPSTVENGIGSVVGVGTWTLPLPLCRLLEAKPGAGEDCAAVLDARSASIVGRVTLDPCGRSAHLPSVRLTERYPGGGAIRWEWKTDWDGAYRFEGLEPGAELVLELDGYTAGGIQIPPLEPGQRYVAPHLTLPNTCGPGSAVAGAAAG